MRLTGKRVAKNKMAGKPAQVERPSVAEIHGEYETRLTRYAARIVGGTERAGDVVQEVFLRLAREDLAALDGHLAPWLYTVTKRLALDARRKETRMQLFTSEQIERAADDTATGGAVEQAEEASRLRTLLAGLPAQQQEAVRLKFQEGLSYREIAAVMELSVNHVGVLLHRALVSLRGGLREADERRG